MKNDRKRTFLLITLPILALFIAFNTVPLIRGVIYSFTNFKGFGSYDWLGFQNYLDLFTDSRVGGSYLFTFKLAIVATIVTNVISLILALGLNSKIRAKSFFRGMYFIPNVLGALVVGYIFRYLFTYILPAFGEMIGSEALSGSMLSNVNTAWIAIVIVCAWQSMQDAASIAIIGAADGPTSIFVAQHFDTQYIGAIIVAAYSYMALVPIVQPPCIRLVTTKKERLMKMEYNPANISRTTRILFPIFVTFIAGIAAPKSVALVGFLMFGNLLRECLVLDSLSETAQKVLANLISLLLGLSVAPVMVWSKFLNINTIVILALGLVAFCFDTIGGVFFVKFLNLFLKKKINPMVGAAGISAFPMSSRVVHKMGLKEDPQNFLLMHAAGANVAGQIASVIAGGMIISLIPTL